MVKRKRIYLNLKMTRYCEVKLYREKEAMQQAYKVESRNKRNHYYRVEGAHIPYHILKIPSGKLLPKTGTVLLHINNCGAGVVTHELMHAVLWADNHHLKRKCQYPVVIRNMEEEEKLLHNLSYAIAQFYVWYWKVEKSFL